MTTTMKTKRARRCVLMVLLTLLTVVVGCREDETVVPITTDDTGEKVVTDYMGMYCARETWGRTRPHSTIWTCTRASI